MRFGSTSFHRFSCAAVRRKRRADTQFVHRVNQAADVLAQHLAKHFVFHRRIGLGADMGAELRFDHTDRGFDV